MKNRKELLSQIAYGCFYLAVVIEVLIVLVDKSNLINPLEGRLFQVTFLLCLVKVCLTKYTRREYITILAFCLLGAVSYFITGRNEIIRLVILAAACKGINMQRCLKLVFWMTFWGCLIIIGLSVTGIYGGKALTEDFGRGCVETRYTLGMGHPNALQCMAWALTVLGLYLYGEIMKWYWYIPVIAVNAGLFVLTDSKTAFLVTTVAVGLYLLNRFLSWNRIGKWLQMIWRFLLFAGGCVLTAGCILISVFIAKDATLLYRYEWEAYWTEKVEFYRTVNRFLNGRIYTLVETDGFQGTIGTWSLFSNPGSEKFFDLGWIRLFYWYGIIPAAVFIIALFILMFFCWRNKKMGALILVISFSFYTLMEAHAISVYLARNYVFFLLGAYWSPILASWKKEPAK